MNATTREAITALDTMRLPELQTRYLEVLGKPTRCPNRGYLARAISEALAANESTSSTCLPNARTFDATSAALVPADEAVTEVIDDNVASTYASDEFNDDVMVPMDDANVVIADGTDIEIDDADAGIPTVTLVPIEAVDSRTIAMAGVLTDTSTDVPQTDATRAKHARGRFRGMTVEELQRKYLEVVGRPSLSQSRSYLQWKIREAEKGRVPIGPVSRRRLADAPLEVKVLPLRIETELVERIDQAWRAKGLRSRTEFFRLAIGNYLEASCVAASFETPQSQNQ